jgi:hypothetical protein
LRFSLLNFCPGPFAFKALITPEALVTSKACFVQGSLFMREEGTSTIVSLPPGEISNFKRSKAA